MIQAAAHPHSVYQSSQSCSMAQFIQTADLFDLFDLPRVCKWAVPNGEQEFITSVRASFRLSIKQIFDGFSS